MRAAAYDEDMPRFTRDEAERLLPKVKPFIEDIQRRKRAFDRNPTDPVAAEIRALVLAVAEMGVQVKALEMGLIDFPAEHAGREVLLCWKAGEGEAIGWWHEVDAGYVGRRPIRELYDN